MIITTKQIRILALAAIPFVWLVYASFFFGIIVYPQNILGSTTNLWFFPEAWTIIWLVLVLTDHFGSGPILSSAIRFLVVYLAVSLLLGLLPDVGSDAYLAGLQVCSITCAILGIDWVGGAFPVFLGIMVIIASVHQNRPRNNSKTYVAYLLAVGTALFIAILFHEVTPQGVFSEERYAALAALPVFLVVQYKAKDQSSEGQTSSWRLIWRAAAVYSILALAYFFADLAALPLILTPANTAIYSIWIIGGSGVQDGNFLYPTTALISYPLSFYLGSVWSNVRMRINLTKTIGSSGKPQTTSIGRSGYRFRETHDM